MLNPLTHLEFRANIEPQELALCDLSNAMTYLQLFILVKKIATKLEVAGVKPGDLVITCLPNKLDWILTNALFHEACITCSNHGYEPIDPCLQPDWVISERPILNIPQSQLLLIDTAWIQDAEEQAPSNVIKPYAREDDLCRLMLTSGTTGGVKAVPYSVKMLTERLVTVSSYWSAAGSEINLMSLATVGGFFSAMNTSLLGEPFYSAPIMSALVKFANQFRIKSLIASPMQLAAFVKEVELSKDDIPPLQEIRSAGGVLPEALSDHLRRLFHAKVFNIYGSTEVGGVSFDLIKQQHHPAHAGYVLPTAEVEIVNELDQRQPFDTEGFIRTKTSSMAHEYFKNPEATAKSFKDGWFYPGDRARLRKNGSLILAGRDSEIINRGGVKIDPVTIDEYLMTYPGIEDAAAFGLVDKIGIERVAAVLVANEAFDVPALRSALLKKFGQTNAPSIFLKVKQIPRNQMGKVMRTQLSQEFAAILAKRDQKHN